MRRYRPTWSADQRPDHLTTDQRLVSRSLDVRPPKDNLVALLGRVPLANLVHLNDPPVRPVHRTVAALGFGLLGLAAQLNDAHVGGGLGPLGEDPGGVGDRGLF